MGDNIPSKLSHTPLNVFRECVIRQECARPTGLKLVMQQFIRENGFSATWIPEQQEARPTGNRPSDHLLEMLESLKRCIVALQHDDSAEQSHHSANNEWKVAQRRSYNVHSYRRVEVGSSVPETIIETVRVDSNGPRTTWVESRDRIACRSIESETVRVVNRGEVRNGCP